jgi:hypothetical protein
MEAALVECATMWWKILLILLTPIALYLLIRVIRAALRFKRSFDEFSAEAGQRLMRYSAEVDSTLERWHEYDEAYQEAVAQLEEQAGGADPSRGGGRGVTLGPSGGSLRKPN